MVEDRITDGRRIAQLLSSELDGRGGRLAAFSVTNARREVEPTADGARAYDVELDGAVVGTAYVQPDRVRVEISSAPDRVLSAAEDAGLRARPKATEPPRTVLFVESGAEVKRVTDAFEALSGE